MSAFARSLFHAAVVTAWALPAMQAQAHQPVVAQLEAMRVANMKQATSAFLDTLTEEQREAVTSALEDNVTRTSWSNLPVSMAPRSGLVVANMSSEQRRALHTMMVSALSSQGYLKSATIMWHEDVLREMFDAMLAELPDSDPRKAQGIAFGDNYDAEKFYVTVFGAPEDENWGWLVTGHHFAANFTVSGDRIAFTPMFLGANPQIVQEGRYAGWQILQHEADKALALLSSLDEGQLERTVVSVEVDSDVFAGPGNQASHETFFGIKASDLNEVQRSLLDSLIDEYLEDASEEAAKRQRAAISADGPETLRFAWWGATHAPRGRYMFRVQGPSVLIDYVREPSPGGAFNHVHSIIRDPSNDYGSDWLERHYTEAHQD
ncbi:DUF3500 domain-containing protein [Qipengyuania sp. GH38]|uniref:DUF3500 domain-containing protein n=1 Tax=Qipengyuania intermedia TaxID=2867244 RepID=UPI001C870122|nr:DUF3500 domain-containing protein [Qipengyuania intermedia]MBX7514900.1 DUF3500 domain-containing protein [Qipengyuania intermedia]